MKAQLKYPILVFDPRDDMVWGFAREKDFQVTTTRLLQKYDRSGVAVVDSTGTKYIIRRAYPAGWRGIHGWTGTRTGVISLENDYEPHPEKLSPDVLREMIAERYLKHQDEEWFEETWVDEPTFREEFAECQTIEELIGMLVRVPRFSLWERLQDYFFRIWLSILALLFLGVLLKKIWSWITGWL